MNLNLAMNIYFLIDAAECCVEDDGEVEEDDK